MGVTNRPPDLKKMIDDLTRRIAALERSRQVSFPVLGDWTQFPRNPQPGQAFIDGSTGTLFIYCEDTTWTTTATATFTANPLTLTVDNASTALQVNQTVAVDGGTGNKFIATVTSVTPPYTVQLTFIAVSPATAVPDGFTATVPPNPTVFPVGTKVIDRSWRQVITSTELINKQGLIATSALTTSSFAGTNSTPGTHTGGTGEIVAYGGYPPYLAS